MVLNLEDSMFAVATRFIAPVSGMPVNDVEQIMDIYFAYLDSFRSLLVGGMTTEVPSLNNPGKYEEGICFHVTNLDHEAVKFVEQSITALKIPIEMYLRKGYPRDLASTKSTYGTQLVQPRLHKETIANAMKILDSLNLSRAQFIKNLLSDKKNDQVKLCQETYASLIPDEIRSDFLDENGLVVSISGSLGIGIQLQGTKFMLTCCHGWSIRDSTENDIYIRTEEEEFFGPVFQFERGVNNQYVDAALLRIIGDVAFPPPLLELEDVYVISPKLGDCQEHQSQIVYNGASTNSKYGGAIKSRKYKGHVLHRPPENRLFYEKNQFHTECPINEEDGKILVRHHICIMNVYARPGDSGSVIFQRDNYDLDSRPNIPGYNFDENDDRRFYDATAIGLTRSGDDEFIIASAFTTNVPFTETPRKPRISSIQKEFELASNCLRFFTTS